MQNFAEKLSMKKSFFYVLGMGLFINSFSIAAGVTSKDYQNLVQWWMQQKYVDSCLKSEEGRVGPGYRFWSKIENRSNNGYTAEAPFYNLKKNELVPLLESKACAKVDFSKKVDEKSQKCFEATDAVIEKFFKNNPDRGAFKSYAFKCALNFGNYCNVSEQAAQREKTGDVLSMVIKGHSTKAEPGLICRTTVNCSKQLEAYSTKFTAGKNVIYCSPNRLEGLSKCEDVKGFDNCPVVVRQEDKVYREAGLVDESTGKSDLDGIDENFK